MKKHAFSVSFFPTDYLGHRFSRNYKQKYFPLCFDFLKWSFMTCEKKIDA